MIYVCLSCGDPYEVRAGETIRCPACGSKDRDVTLGPAPEPAPADLPEDVFARADRLCGQWERNAGPLPPDARHLSKRLLRRVVLDAARVCERRAAIEAKPMSVRNEASKCASAVRHWLLCGENQQVCVPCDGEGCRRCRWAGVVDLPPLPGG
jgi:hypothetical protein